MTIKLEVGKRYRLRNGRMTEPLDQLSGNGGVYHALVGRQLEQWHADGSYYECLGQSDWDIIEELPESQVGVADAIKLRRMMDNPKEREAEYRRVFLEVAMRFRLAEFRGGINGASGAQHFTCTEALDAADQFVQALREWDAKEEK